MNAGTLLTIFYLLKNNILPRLILKYFIILEIFYKKYFIIHKHTENLPTFSCSGGFIYFINEKAE